MTLQLYAGLGVGSSASSEEEDTMGLGCRRLEDFLLFVLADVAVPARGSMMQIAAAPAAAVAASAAARVACATAATICISEAPCGREV